MMRQVTMCFHSTGAAYCKHDCEAPAAAGLQSLSVSDDSFFYRRRTAATAGRQRWLKKRDARSPLRYLRCSARLKAMSTLLSQFGSVIPRQKGYVLPHRRSGLDGSVVCRHCLSRPSAVSVAHPTITYQHPWLNVNAERDKQKWVCVVHLRILPSMLIKSQKRTCVGLLAVGSWSIGNLPTCGYLLK